MKTKTLVIVALLALIVSTTHGATIHVDIANCPGPGDGTVGDPYCSIQTAIDNAVDTDEIVVAPGTYFETIDFVGKAITLRSSDGPEVTTIDAQQMGSVVTCDSGEGPDTVLEGFTITGGNASQGGGMRNFQSSPTVTNCTFSGNVATTVGGGMFNATNSNPTVTNCTFSGNVATSLGGGMHNSGSSPIVTNCIFSGNTAGQSGGGMINSGSSPTVTNCTFSGNTANFRGGGMLNDFSDPTVIGCTFIANEAGIEGGGMLNSSANPPRNPTVIDTVFSCNTPDQITGLFNSGDGRVVVVGPSCPPLPPECPADLDGDGNVGINDFLDLLAAWGPCK